MGEEMITITKEEYDELSQNYNFMQCLERAGVDNRMIKSLLKLLKKSWGSIGVQGMIL